MKLRICSSCWIKRLSWNFSVIYINFSWMLMKSSMSEQSHQSIALRTAYPFLCSTFMENAVSVKLKVSIIWICTPTHSFTFFPWGKWKKKTSFLLKFTWIHLFCFVLLSRKEVFYLGHANLMLCLFSLHRDFVKVLSGILDLYYSAVKQPPSMGNIFHGTPWTLIPTMPMFIQWEKWVQCLARGRWEPDTIKPKHRLSLTAQKDSG